MLIKLKYILISSFLAVFIIACQLFNLQINKMLKFFNLSRSNFLRYEKIAPPRGNIIDCNNELLATNRPITNIYWQGSGTKKLDPEKINIIKKIKELLEFDDLFLEKIINTEKNGSRILLINDANIDQISKIVELFSAIDNIVISKSFRRFYPHNNMACHVLGYLSFVGLDSIGRMGLEMLFEESLKGQPGQILKTINSTGKKLNEKEISNSLIGYTIKTTLDINLQKIAETVFPEDESGALIIMDPEDGSLKTILSKPNFNPNMFLNTINNDEWHKIQSNQALLNRALNACYPPASIFKLVTIATALDKKIITTESNWYCTGKINFAKRDYHCNNLQGHGTVNTEQALKYSCNIPLYEIAKKVKIDLLAEYANYFGLGLKTEIIFPEKSGLIPTQNWKKTILKQPWWPGETLSATIGQSYLLVTPIQIACMISGICQGYLVKPKILETEETIKRPIHISPEILLFLKQSMKSVIKGGTGKKLSRLKNIEIYAKSGTAQTSDLSKRDLGKKFAEHGWFVANFNYKDEKPLTMIILIENVGSSRFSIEVALNFLKKYCELFDERNL